MQFHPRANIFSQRLGGILCFKPSGENELSVECFPMRIQPFDDERFGKLALSTRTHPCPQHIGALFKCLRMNRKPFADIAFDDVALTIEIEPAS